MGHVLRRTLALSFLTLLLWISLACKAKSPEEKVAETRQQYVVEQVSWLPQAVEPEPVEPLVTEEGAGEEAMTGDSEEPASADDAAAADEEVVADVAPGPQPTDILFDVVLRFTGNEPLPGLTLDITHADPFEKEKEVRRHYVETGDMGRASNIKQIGFTLEGFQFEEGDVFSIDLLQHVPPEDRGAYREFGEAAP